MKEPKCPECEKLKAVSARSQEIGEFIDWLSTKGFCLASYRDNELCASHLGIEQLLAGFFEINLNKVEKERRQLLDWLRFRNEEDLKRTDIPDLSTTPA